MMIEKQPFLLGLEHRTTDSRIFRFCRMTADLILQLSDDGVLLDRHLMSNDDLHVILSRESKLCLPLTQLQL